MAIRFRHSDFVLVREGTYKLRPELVKATKEADQSGLFDEEFWTELLNAEFHYCGHCGTFYPGDLCPCLED